MQYLQKRDWIRAVKSMLVIFHFYVYEVKRYESSHNSFLWRQLTAWEPSPKTSFVSPECPQPLASSVPGKVPCKQSPGVSGMVASPVCRFIGPVLPDIWNQRGFWVALDEETEKCTTLEFDVGGPAVLAATITTSSPTPGVFPAGTVKSTRTVPDLPRA